MKSSFFVFLLLIITCSGLQWMKLNEFNESFREFEEAVENALLQLKVALRNVTLDSLSFLIDIERSSMVNNLNSAKNMYPLCPPSLRSFNLEDMKISFNTEVNRLEIPLMKRTAELNGKISSVKAVLGSIEEVADTKYWSCKMLSEDCLPAVELWLNHTLENMACEIVGCSKHNIRKRQWYFQDIKETNSYDEETEEPDHIKKFRCSNSRYIDTSKRCDGTDDCGDNSDESLCSKITLYSPTKCNIELGTYLCENKNCVDLDKVCNGRDDCGDGSDEGENCTKGCSKVCQPRGVCFRSPKGGDCLNKCPRGTLETLDHCENKLQPIDSSIMHQVEEIPHLLSRHTSAYFFLKTSFIFQIDRAIGAFTDCFPQRFFPLLNITSREDSSSINLSNSTSK